MCHSDFEPVSNDDSSIPEVICLHAGHAKLSFHCLAISLYWSVSIPPNTTCSFALTKILLGWLLHFFLCYYLPVVFSVNFLFKTTNNPQSRSIAPILWGNFPVCCPVTLRWQQPVWELVPGNGARIPVVYPVAVAVGGRWGT